MSLRTFLTRLIWLCVLPGFLIAVWLAATHVQDLHDESDREGRRLARNVAAVIDQYLIARIGALQILAASPLADEPARWSEFRVEAQGLAGSLGGAVVVAGLDGSVRLHSDVPAGQPLPRVARPAGVSAFDAALASGHPAVGDTFQEPVAGERRVAIAAPALRDGHVRLVMLNVASADRLAQRLAELALPAGWSFVVNDSRGVPIVQVGDGAAAAPEASAPDRDEARDSHFRADPALAPWHVDLTIPHGDRVRPLVQASAVMAGAILGATLVAVLGAGWASTRLARAVRSLAEAPAAGSPAADITEIHTVRHLLDDAARARDQAENEQRVSEARYRASLEQASVALQVREAQLRGIFDSANDAILTVDETDTIVMANPAAARVFRSSVEALVGAPLDGLIPPHARAHHRADIRAFGESEPHARPMGHRVGVTGLRADGVEFPIEGAISQVHVDGQRLFTVILRDITDRQRAEQELRASKTKLEAALAGMNDAVFLSDTDGRLVEFNDAFASFHRFRDKGECLRTLAEYPDLFELALADGAPAPLAQWPVPRALRGEVGSLMEFHVRRKDSGERWIGSYSFAPIRDAEGRIVGAVVTARDVTELKRVQAELEVSHGDLRRLVAAQDSVQEAERKRIARELHDDLQQTLAAILMESTAMRGDSEPSAVAVLEGLVRIDRLATAAIVSTRRIVNDLRPQMLEELGLVPALEALARRFVERSGIACELDAAGFDPPAPGTTGSVATCLFRVTQEALNNVAKHAQARHVHIELREPAPALWRLTIRDDGTGLHEHERRKRGSFGLLGMRERVHAVGGTIRVHGDPGAGTTVEVEVGVTDVRADGGEGPLL